MLRLFGSFLRTRSQVAHFSSSRLLRSSLLDTPFSKDRKFSKTELERLQDSLKAPTDNRQIDEKVLAERDMRERPLTDEERRLLSVNLRMSHTKNPNDKILKPKKAIVTTPVGNVRSGLFLLNSAMIAGVVIGFFVMGYSLVMESHAFGDKFQQKLKEIPSRVSFALRAFYSKITTRNSVTPVLPDPISTTPIPEPHTNSSTRTDEQNSDDIIKYDAAPDTRSIFITNSNPLSRWFRSWTSSQPYAPSSIATTQQQQSSQSSSMFALERGKSTAETERLLEDSVWSPEPKNGELPSSKLFQKSGVDIASIPERIGSRMQMLSRMAGKKEEVEDVNLRQAQEAHEAKQRQQIKDQLLSAPISTPTSIPTPLPVAPASSGTSNTSLPAPIARPWGTLSSNPGSASTNSAAPQSATNLVSSIR